MRKANVKGFTLGEASDLLVQAPVVELAEQKQCLALRWTDTFLMEGPLLFLNFALQTRSPFYLCMSPASKEVLILFNFHRCPRLKVSYVGICP